MAVHFKRDGRVLGGCDQYNGRGELEVTTDESEVTCRRCKQSIEVEKRGTEAETPESRTKGGPRMAKKKWKLSCLSCGYELKESGYRFCPHCGHQFDNSKAGRILSVCRQALVKVEINVKRLKKNGSHRQTRDVLRQIIAIAEEPESK